MMRRLHFILSAHPYAMDRGDAAVTRLLLDVASDMAHVEASALWSGEVAAAPIPVSSLPRPPLRWPRLVVRSALARRSLLHTRFDHAPLVRHLRGVPADAFVAVHAYMAEPFFSAFPPESRAPLYVNYVVSESDVLTMSPRWHRVRMFEARRTLQDDLRCCGIATGTGCFSQPELEALAARGTRALTLLRICLPPHGPPPSATGPHLLFLGDRSWYPNLDGLRRLCSWWPDVARRVPTARLLVVGPGPVPPEARQPGIDVVGYVANLDQVWADSRALVAPLTVGGGVRVKILEAAARGVPVIATAAAIGTLHDYLQIGAVDGREQFIEACISVLTDAGGARQRAERIFEGNRAWWEGGHFRADVRTWLGL